MNKQLRNDTALPTHFMTDEQQALADLAEKFFMSEFHHLNAEMDDTDDLPASVFPKLGEMGYLGLNVPPEFGGAGLDFTSACIITEQMSRASAAIGLTHVAHDNLCVNNIYRNASDDLRRKYLPGLCDGTLIGALGLTEPGAGSDALGSMRTTAKKDGDDYILNGSKTFITNGQNANLVIVVTKTDPSAGAKGTSLIVVETDDAEGFERGRNLDKIGLKSNDTSELFFNDVRVPTANLLGHEEGLGFIQLMQQLPQERLQIGGSAIAMCERALAVTIDYVKERKAFGKAVIEFQNTQFTLAELKTEATVGRTFYNFCVGEHLEGRLTPELASMAKYWLSDLQGKITDACLQLHGGYGYMNEYPIARMFRDARVQRIYGGTNEIMKLLIARGL